MCRTISGSISNPIAGGLDGTAGDASNSANNVDAGSSCAGFEPVEGVLNKATSRETSWKYGTCVVFTDAVN